MSDSDDINWYSNDAATFGDRVAAAREAAHMSQKDLARHLGVALKTVEGWENDISQPRSNKLQTLSGILNVSMSWLLTGEGDGIATDMDVTAFPDVPELLSEMRVLRTDMLRCAERLGLLEKRLKTAVGAAVEHPE